MVTHPRLGSGACVFIWSSCLQPAVVLVSSCGLTIARCVFVLQILRYAAPSGVWPTRRRWITSRSVGAFPPPSPAPLPLDHLCPGGSGPGGVSPPPWTPRAPCRRCTTRSDRSLHPVCPPLRAGEPTRRRKDASPTWAGRSSRSTRSAPR